MKLDLETVKAVQAVSGETIAGAFDAVLGPCDDGALRALYAADRPGFWRAISARALAYSGETAAP